MTTQAASDLAFGLTRVVDLPALCTEAGLQLSADDIAQIVEEADRFTREAVRPKRQEADHHGAVYANGTVTTAPHYPALYKSWIDAGWQGIAAPADHGGQGLPQSLWFTMTELLMAADTSFALCPMLTTGAMDCIERYANSEQKARWLPPMISAEWTGAMCLTEPQAGSDLAQVKTRAEPLGNDRYAIHGQKIFITWGEHDCTANTIYLILARLPDAPPGSKGISLFAATKLNANGSRNALRCGGIEKKLGIHASPTCTMLFEGAEAEMVGEPHRGLPAMFAMMNSARLGVGVQGVAHGAQAEELAFAYAAQRVQGGGKPIAEHPDVARMLNEIRATTLSGRLLWLEAAHASDRFRLLGDRAAETRLALLTPIVKAWCTDRGVDAASIGIQVHGGMGFVESAGAAQVLRDARIAPIYEGTNGIQAMDLVGRKLAMDGGKAMRSLIAEVRAADPRLSTAAGWLETATVRALEAASRGPDAIQEIAVAYLDAAGWVLGGWMLARAAAADASRYGAVADFYLRRMLPRASARVAEIEGVLAA